MNNNSNGNGIVRRGATIDQRDGLGEATKILHGGSTVSGQSGVWREPNGVLRFSVTSDGTTGEGWINRIQNSDLRVAGFAKEVLRSKYFKPTTGVTTEIAVLNGLLFENNLHMIQRFRDEATLRDLTPNAEVACLIRVKFNDNMLRALGFDVILVMHDSMRTADNSWLLGVARDSTECVTGDLSVMPISLISCFAYDRFGYAFAVAR
jgi:hypothetical protein